MLKLSLKDLGAGQAVKQLVENVSRPQKMLQEMGMVMLSSIQQNFIAQGRPVPLVPSQRAIRQHGQTLRDTGRLMNSITMKVDSNSVRVGTNVVYAAAQNFGHTYDKAVNVKGYVRYYKHNKASIGNRKPTYSTVVKGHSRTMNHTLPARPFMILQADDWDTIKLIGYNYLIPVVGAP